MPTSFKSFARWLLRVALATVRSVFFIASDMLPRRSATWAHLVASLSVTFLCIVPGVIVTIVATGITLLLAFVMLLSAITAAADPPWFAFLFSILLTIGAVLLFVGGVIFSVVLAAALVAGIVMPIGVLVVHDLDGREHARLFRRFRVEVLASLAAGTIVAALAFACSYGSLDGFPWQAPVGFLIGGGVLALYFLHYEAASGTIRMGSWLVCKVQILLTPQPPSQKAVSNPEALYHQ